MGVNDELAKLVAEIPHAHYCAMCDTQFRCKRRCWGKTSWLCSTCEAYKYGDAESYRVGSEASEDEPQEDA